MGPVKDGVASRVQAPGEERAGIGAGPPAWQRYRAGCALPALDTRSPGTRETRVRPVATSVMTREFK